MRRMHRTTIIAGIAGLLTMGTVATGLFLDQTGAIHLFSDEVNTYTYQFVYDDGDGQYRVLNEGTAKRGDQITVPALPAQESDLSGAIYIPLGWDTVGLGVPNLFQSTKYRIYSDTYAKPVYLKKNVEDIDPASLLDLYNMLADAGIDIMKILSWLGLNEDDILDLGAKPAFTFHFTNDVFKCVPIYFRGESLGNIRTRSYAWSDAPKFDASKWCPNGSNPLEFSASKISSKYGSYPISITYYNKANKYPAPSYELNNAQYNTLKSDTYQVTNLTKNDDETYTYTSNISGVFEFPLGTKWYLTTPDELATTVTELKNIPFSSNAMKNDEEKYSEFVYKNYLTIPDQYKTYFGDFAKNHDLSEYTEGDYTILGKVRDVVKSLANYWYTNFNFGRWPNDPIKKFMEGSSENAIGQHFNTVATLLFRRLGLPARFVGGYRWLPFEIDDDSKISEAGVNGSITNFANGGENSVVELMKHNWTEVYIKGLGWIEVDCCPLPEAIESQYGNIIGAMVGNGSKAADISSGINGNGTGSKSYNSTTMFEFESDYVGTQYFKSASYSVYSENKWSDIISTIPTTITQGTDGPTVYETALNSAGITNFSSSELTALQASTVFKGHDFKIFYDTSANYPAVPYYGTLKNNSGSYPDNDIGATEAVSYEDSSKLSIDANKVKKTFSSYNVEFNEENMNMLKSQYYRSSTSVTPNPLILSNTKLKNATAYENYLANTYYKDAGNYKSKFDHMFDGTYSSNVEKIKTIFNYFKNNFEFSVGYNEDLEQVEYLNDAFGNPTTNIDHLTYFLDVSKEGDSTLFATALTLALRANGFAARYVTGYGANCRGTYKEGNLTKYYRNKVSKETSHAWSEVYISGVGWIMLDATGFDDGHGSNDGLGTTNSADGLYGDGFGGNGVVSTEQVMKIDLAMSIEGAQIDGNTLKVTKTYDGKPFDLDNIKLKNTVTLWPGDRFEFHYGEDVYDSDITTAVKPGRYICSFYFLIYDSDNNIVYNSMKSPEDQGNPEHKYYDPLWDTYGSETHDGSYPRTMFILQIEKQPLYIVVHDISVRAADWINVYGGETLDVKTNLSELLIIEFNNTDSIDKFIADGDTVSFEVEGSLDSIGNTSIMIKNFKILNSKNEDVTYSCYLVNITNGSLSIG